MKNIFIHLLIVFLSLILIFGLIIGGQSNHTIEKFNSNVIENLFPDVSNENDIESGTSQYFNWGKPEIIPITNNTKDNIKDDDKLNNDKYFVNNNINKSIDNYFIYVNGEKKYINERDICKSCDITLNKDIDKYVLKSSIPPYPDMSKYALKSMIGKNINMNDYVHKNEIKPCPQIDFDKYILKSEIKSNNSECKPCDKKHCDEHRDEHHCPECKPCPKCPINPKYRGSKIYNYKIIDKDINQDSNIKNDYIDRFKELTRKCIEKITQYNERNKKYDEDIKNLNDRINQEHNKYNELQQNFEEEKKNLNNKINEQNKNESKNNESKNNEQNIQEKKYVSPLLNNTLEGGYTGDSLYAFI